MPSKSLKENLEILRQAGLTVPLVVDRFAEDQDLRRRDICSVWECNCGHVYESPINIRGYDHGCGKVAKLTWSLGDGFLK